MKKELETVANEISELIKDIDSGLVSKISVKIYQYGYLREKITKKEVLDKFEKTVLFKDYENIEDFSKAYTEFRLKELKK